MSTPEPYADSESDSENAPLNPAVPSNSDVSHDPGFNISPDADEMNTPHKRDSTYILVLYGLSFFVSIIGLACALAGYGITLTAPFDKDSKKWHLQSYEKNFWEMQSIVVLLAINVLFTALNFRISFNGSRSSQDLRDLMVLLNTVYDFLMWAAFIAFGVSNMIWMLWDRRLCDGWDKPGDEETYKKCDVAMFQLLVVEMIAVNLGILAAVLHFILLIGRCCTCTNRQQQAQSRYLRQRIRQEEEVLMELMERRRQLVEETEGLEARRFGLGRPLPHIPTETAAETMQEEEEQPPQYEENLIDIETSNTENSALAAGAEAVSVPHSS